MNLTLAAIVMAALPFTVVDKTGPDTTVRHLTGKELGGTLQKGMTPEALYSQVLLAKTDGYQIHITARDKSGLAEIHSNWSDHIFIQEGEASFVIGGVAVDAKDTAPGEKRGTAIKGGAMMVMRPGDYLFIPPGTPHQMILKPGQRVKFIGFRTHK
jgi:mannose-6-phosphate isomerase-like protein (cupin superfamily)